VCEIRHFLTPNQHKRKAQTRSLGFFLWSDAAAQCMGSSRRAAPSRMRAVPRIARAAA